MSYRSRVYRQRNPRSNDDVKEQPFFSSQQEASKSKGNGSFFQAKLSVNEPGDSYEKEADSVANAVVNKSSKTPVVQQKKISSIQRLSTPVDDEKLGTNDARMARDKEIQEKPMPAEEKKKKGIQKMDDPAKEKDKLKGVQKKDDPMKEKEKLKGVQKKDDPMKEKEKLKGVQKKDDPMKEEELKKSAAVQTKQDSGGTAPSQVSSKIHETSGKGNALPSQTLHEMSSSFGVDFSDVRIHKDDEATAMNQELQAQAFTYGNDIYFNQGKYDPESSAGKFLLAHELTHVVQQQGGEPDHRDIQRSFWGTVAGAVGGFIVGGPVGAVIGGIGGDALTTDTRPLSEAEKTEAKKVFRNSLDYDVIKVSDTSTLMSIGDNARTPYNTIYFPADTLSSGDYYPWMIHELTHTWQTQQGVSVLTKLGTALGGEDAYKFGGEDGLKQAMADGWCFNNFNTEQQGDILENYYKISEGMMSGDLSVYEYFVDQVRYSRGNCTTDILDPKYRPDANSDQQMA